ncbi:HAD family hydrolase [Salininema proteolyticum]|uniref:HAD family hydrolase n=1 Tax=Salininema proteolyticum TaxID=1607685 RepID=A0ABV8U1N3_9ACTN
MNDIPKALLWDMDGTLIDTEPLWDEVMEEILAEHGRAMTSEIRHSMVGSSESGSIPIMLDASGLEPDAENYEWMRVQFNTRITAKFQRGVAHLAGAQDMLREAAAAGIPQALVTSTNRELTEHLLPHIGRGHFDLTVTSSDIERPKPDPQPYLRAAEKLGVDPADALVLEDSPTGIRAAVAAGANVVAVPSPVPPPPELGLERTGPLDRYRLSDLFAMSYRAA